MRRLLVIALVLAAALLVPAGARAQALPPIDYSQYDPLIGTLGIPYLPAGGTHHRGSRSHKPKHATKRQRGTLRFVRSQRVTQEIYAGVAEDSGQDLATVTAQLDAAKAELRRVLTRVLRWRSADVADVYAFGLLQAYSYVRGVNSPPRRGMAWLRRGVGDDLARDADVRRLSDADQQRIAEQCELRTIFLISGVVGARMRRDAAAEAEALAAFRAWAKDIYGVDVAKVRLTSRGFRR